MARGEGGVRRTNTQMKLVMICFHNVNICRAARGTRRGAHVKGAGSGIDLERGGRTPSPAAHGAGDRGEGRGSHAYYGAALRKGAARLMPCLRASLD